MAFEFKLTEQEDLIYYDWITERHDGSKGKVSFGIRYVNEETMNQINKDVRASKGKKKKDIMHWDNLLYQRKVARHAIRDIKATYRDLNAVTEPQWVPTVPGGNTWDDEVPFDNNVKEFVVRGMIGDVADFIIEAAGDADTFRKKAEAEELANLPSGSNTSQNMPSTGNN